MTQPVILCADDYALAPGVSRAILDLVACGRLSATGCMTVSPFWIDHADWLRPWADRIDVGLHLTLTDHQPTGPMPRLAPEGRLPPLGRLMRLALTGGLDPDEISAEIARQVALFITVFGAPPAFLDGHQHVHLLPVVRDAVVAMAKALPGSYLRDCREPLPAILHRGVATTKALVIDRLGSGLARLIKQHHLPANGGFRGIYDFSNRVPFAELMARFLDPATPETHSAPPPLVMCHPGLPDPILRRIDPVTDQRRVEYEFLRSASFADLLATQGVTLTRLALDGDGQSPRRASS
jgi:hypothetical protein